MTMRMRMRIVEARFYLQMCSTRLPFRFGMHTLTRAPLGILQATVEFAQGDRIDGFASDLLVPKVVRKGPRQDLRRGCCRSYRVCSAGHPRRCRWQTVYALCL